MRQVRPHFWLAFAGGLLVAAAAPLAQTGTTASAMLEAAIQSQLVSGDVAGAIKQYEAILAKYGDQRRIAAQARLRLAQAQEQVGRLDEAVRHYERLLVENSDDAALVRTVQVRMDELNERINLEELGPAGQLEALDRSSRPSVGVATLQENYFSDSSNYGFGYANRVTNRYLIYNGLSVYDRNGAGETRKLTADNRQAAYPLLSPNGAQVAYLSWDGDLKEVMARRDSGFFDSRVTPELRVVNIGGDNDRVIARFRGVEWLRPYAWSADNASILTLIEKTSGLRQIALIRVQNGEVRVLKEMPWLPVQDMALSSDQRLVAYRVVTKRISPHYQFVILQADSRDPSASERPYEIPVGPQRKPVVTDDDLAIHALNRLGFGPRRGDIERVKKIGFDAYIEQQLRPETIADPVVNAIVGNFRSLKMELPELLAATAPVAVIADRKRSNIFDRAAVVERNQAMVRATGATPQTRMSSDPFLVDANTRPLDSESQMARMIRAVHSEKQLQEVLVDFWMNHFSVNHNGDDRLVPSFEEQAIRANVFGKFETMLTAVARNPKMLFYLDNWRSSAPAEVMKQRLAELEKNGSTEVRLSHLKRQPFLKDSKGINENYARELLELHTMGVDSGYTQQDVINVAKILSGWTIKTDGVPGAFEEEGLFTFDPVMHVDGDKVVLGQTFKSGGVDEGLALLRMLAARTETARFISAKLARRFIADAPPAAVVDEATKTFLRTGGDLREVVRTILMSAQFRSADAIKAKVKKPFELVASALRAVDASFEDNSAYLRLLDGNNNFISRMGERMYDHEAPDGNPDVGAAWMNSNALLVRFEFANALATNKIAGIKINNLAQAETFLEQRLGVTKPTPQQIEQTRATLQAIEDKNAAMLGLAARNDMMMMTGRGAGPAEPKPTINPAAITLAAMLASPQFQKR
jgi:uncharacterized protein (DUF1800 family)